MNDIEAARRRRALRNVNPFSVEGGTLLHETLMSIPRADRFKLLHSLWARGALPGPLLAVMMDEYGKDEVAK